MTKLDTIKNYLENIDGVINVEALNFIEDDKLHLKVILKEFANHAEIKEEIVTFVKITCEVPKLRYEQEIKKDALAIDSAKKLIIASGKGGVGKSSVTANIANTLANQGYKVAIIDADIYGSSIPMIFNTEQGLVGKGDKLAPVSKGNIQLIGSSNVNPKNEPIVWRGPMLGKLINNFFRDVDWDIDTDYLLIDLPPGTGDIPLDLNGIIPDAKTLIVTTPHINASKVAIKAGEMSIMQKHEIIGVVENMSFYNHNDEKLFIFGSGGGDKVAESLSTNLLSQIPISTPKEGYLFTENDEAYKNYIELCKKIEKLI